MLAGATIRVLGPIDLLSATGPRSVGGPHARRLLGALVVWAGRAVPADQLAEVIWGQAAPDTSRATLQSLVSRLRRQIGQDTILRADHAYLLDVESGNVDAFEFERLVAAADRNREDADRCRADCRAALSLWRGVPFGDLADDDPFRLEALRLREIRLAAVELSLASDIALGHAGFAVGSLECAIEEHPYRERLWHLLIKALAAEGRRVEALRTCDRLRRVLADVGLEAGDELGALEDDIAAAPRWRKP